MALYAIFQLSLAKDPIIHKMVSSVAMVWIMAKAANTLAILDSEWLEISQGLAFFSQNGQGLQQDAFVSIIL